MCLRESEGDHKLESQVITDMAIDKGLTQNKDF